jgi:hypothetical protein
MDISCYRPVPISVTVCGEALPLSPMLKLPVKVPVAAGLNAT